ncbi:MAG: sbcC, partial [Actinomycetia bacterium]|nr:sbcC [Actinomycetes bacterium]
ALAAIGEPLDLSGIEQEGRLAGDRLTAAKAALDAARSLRARLDERRVQMAAAEQALAEAATRTAELHRAIDTRVRLEKACGLNGVPALILETAVIPYIETETARVLADLGTPFQVELRTQREKKDGALADTLEVVIVTDTGESPYRKLSGGEKMRVSIALRVALGRLLAGRSGSRSRLFVIDEPRWLDQAGIEALIESLRGLLGEFSRIYVVTQSGTALRDSFDQVLCVVKDGGVSRVEDGYAVEAEAVAA